MKPFLFFLLLLSQFAVAGEKGNGHMDFDMKFQQNQNKICVQIVNDFAPLEDTVELVIEEERFSYDREDVLNYCCTNVMFGSACLSIDPSN